MKKNLILITILVCSIVSQAQYKQTIRGRVVDKESDFPLIGVNVVIAGSNPVIGTATDESGEFTLSNLNIGKYTLVISYLGYKSAVIRDIELNSAKQQVIEVSLEEQVITTEEVTVKGYRKGETLNKMASVSARSFTVAETERYAGSLGDPARMAANYAGVSRAGDDRNDIIIRGNSPTGLQWRLEGMNIPNPNHWGASGSTGGPVSILNNNTLANSDFFTGAFPAEYGNALSGVFDLKMRSGNNQKHEFTGQVGFNGFELMAEGPFSKDYKGSFMITGRYSVLKVMDLLGFDVAGGAVPEYHDVTFKIDLPTEKAGKFAIFGIGGRSYIQMIGSETENSEKYNTLNSTDTYNGSDLGILGITHQYFLNEDTYIYTTASLSGTRVYTKVDSAWYTLIPPSDPLTDTLRIKNTKLYYGEKNSEIISTASTRLVKKINSRNTLTLGIGAEHHQIAYRDSAFSVINNYQFYQYLTDINRKGLFLVDAYIEWQHKFNNKLTLNTGVYSQDFLYNNSKSLEPRAGLSYEPIPTHKFSIGYGMHSKQQAMFYYFIQTYDESSRTYSYTNKNLDFTRAHHLVLGYDHMFGENVHLKSELYYQWLYDVPVTQNPSNFSMLNEGASFHLDRIDSLVNTGTGKNYGLEMTLEKYLTNNWYFMSTMSLFDSWYKGSDNVERHTAFAANYAFNVLGGYEYRINESYSIDLNTKVTYGGGKRNYYLDEQASLLKGEAVYDGSKAFSEREKDYFRLDLRISLKNNHKKYYQEWAADFTNLTNHKNVFSRSYNPDTDKIEFVYQQGFFPMFLYRINF